jgi:alpha-N-arabinofuranosidase
MKLRAGIAVMGLAASLASPVKGVSPGVGSRPSVALLPQVVVSRQGLGLVSKYLFGANLLWAANSEGAFDPTTGHFYPSFADVLRRIGVTMIRYPGGTTSDSFDWERAIGPQGRRGLNEPYGMQASKLSGSCCILDGPQSSTVGPDEFGRLLDETGAAGTITVNFATGTAQEAADFVAYMTAPSSAHPSSDPAEPSYWAARRAKDGHPAPYDVPYWEVGNEQFFPGQYGWRSGRPVRLGPHARPCPPGEIATCLYAFGGTTAFTNEAVGNLANELPSASLSTGAPNQRFYVYFPPVVPGSATIYVDGRPWAEVPELSKAGPKAPVYELDPATGAITFGDGSHGKIPPIGAKITASYKSGPHGGFVEFYRAMKAMDPHIHVCESEGLNVSFLALMGHQFRYDCVVLHEYARPPDVTAALTRYEEALMAYPVREGTQLARLQTEIRHYSGRNVPVLMTEYGQLVAPVPVADPAFNLSLEEGLLEAAQLMEWMAHRLPVAEKYLGNSAPFTLAGLTLAFRTKGQARVMPLALSSSELRQALSIGRAMVNTGLSPDSGMVADWGTSFVAEPTGLVLGLMRELAGQELLRVWVKHGPLLPHADRAPVLWATASTDRHGQITLVVVNVSPKRPVLAEISLPGYRQRVRVGTQVLDGPSPISYNTPSSPATVHDTSHSFDIRTRDFGSARGFYWRFPPHSVTLLRCRWPITQQP